jgi:hypothetical protein
LKQLDRLIEIIKDVAKGRYSNEIMEPAEHVELEKQVGMQIAEEVAAATRAMWLPSVRATPQTVARENDIMIRG